MKKAFLVLTICTISLITYSQDKTDKKVEKKVEKTSTKIKNKTDTIRHDLDKKADSAVKKVYPKAHKIKE